MATRDLLRLAWPVVASQASIMAVSFADTYMVGQLGDAELGAISFTSNLLVPAMFFGIGVAASVTPVVGRRLGRGDNDSIAHTIWHARRLNLFILMLQLVVLCALWAAIPLMGQPAEVEAFSIWLFPILIGSIVGQQQFVGLRTVIEGLQDTATPMRIALTCNVMNIIGNYVLIFGVGSWDGIGVYGAVVSTLLARTAMWLCMEVTLARRLKQMGVTPTPFARNATKTLFLSGLPVGAQSVVECLGFTVCGIMMGWIGTAALAAHQIVNLFTSLTYLMASGVASAVTIKVSVCCGAADRPAARRYAWTGLGIVILFMLGMGVVFISFRDVLPGFFTQSAEAVAIAADLMVMGAIFQPFDGTQVTAIGALRGYGDLRFPAVVAGLAFAATTIPTAYICGFTLGFGYFGVWTGTIAGLLLASVLLIIRLRRKTV